ncbi:MAG: ATP-binding protein [Phycisphaerae bacterium]|nr:ATP-binding protein [Phycisphaerae bacterium]
MRVAIASGKGGTGKTTVATNLAYVVASSGCTVAYIDCDVEEPNGHLFLRPAFKKSEPVAVLHPKVNEGECQNCGQCGEICQYSAIVNMPTKVLVFPALCHACGGCVLVCPCKAISEVPRQIGCVNIGNAGDVQFVEGRLNIGEAMSPPVIRAVKRAAPEAEIIFTDAPPGTSCPVIESVRDADFVILVTEPTPFGLHDLTLAVETMRKLELPFGVVVNRADAGDRRVVEYCAQEQITLLAEIPDDRRVAQAYSRGELASNALPEMRDMFAALWADVRREVETSLARPLTKN